MFLKNGQITRSRLTDFDVALVQMPMQQWVKGRMKALCLSIALAVAGLGGSKDLPELDPQKCVSPAPGKAYEAP
ncbi:MAG: hypothetical protein ISS68_14465, partial [Desulfobacteraceae bacterium]|nr:hypothetical protein [Desulfobacteraceae bacterium]